MIGRLWRKCPHLDSRDRRLVILAVLLVLNALVVHQLYEISHHVEHIEGMMQ